MNVVLIGFRGAGKTSVGKALAVRLGRSFIDCDDYIEEKTQLSIREIFDLGGESRFRVLESEAICELSKLDGKVISTGGGAPLKYKNMHALKRNGIVVFLEVGPEASYQRIQADQQSASRRPALTDLDLATEVRKQIEFRKPYYERAADHRILTDGRKLEAVVDEILGRLKEHGIEEGRGQDGALA